MVPRAHRGIFQLLHCFSVLLVNSLTAILYSVSITASAVFIFQLLVSVTVN